MSETTLENQAQPEDTDKLGAGATAARPASVGARLRAAREDAKLSVAEVAQSLKFSPRQIESLEADDYEALPGNTIVRGFVRGYARLVKLDADELLRILGDHSPNAPADVRPPDNMGIASQPGNDKQISPVVSAAIVLALAALLLALWHYFGPGTGKSATVAITQTQQAHGVSSVAPAPTPVDGAASPGQAPVVAATGDVGGGAAAANSTPVVAAPAGTGATLLFVFQDRSWLEVSDGRKQKLHSGENPAGGRLSLVGTPPFDIVVGNAGRVTLTYGDRVIDLAPHTRADVARLTLE